MGCSTNSNSLALKISTFFFNLTFQGPVVVYKGVLYAEFFVLFYKIEWRELGNPAVVRAKLYIPSTLNTDYLM